MLPVDVTVTSPRLLRAQIAEKAGGDVAVRGHRDGANTTNRLSLDPEPAGDRRTDVAG
jgi:hypothetical protein